jgi:predicted dehydrogenase
MIAGTPAEAMIICTPTVTHVPFALRGLAAGLAVLTEKGMAPDWLRACQVVAAAEAAGRPLCVVQNFRYRPVEQAIQRALSETTGAQGVGEVFWADYFDHRVRPEPRTLSYPFASVWDQSCHHFDNLLAWFGPAERITGRAAAAPWTAYAHPSNTAALITFSRGTTVVYGHTHDAARAEIRLRFQGRRGALFATESSVEFSERPETNFGVKPVRPIPLEAVHGGERGVLQAFHRYITEGVEPGISGRHNLEVMALCQMLVMSIEQDRTVYRRELGGGARPPGAL